jgi:hypothetical protein
MKKKKKGKRRQKPLIAGRKYTKKEERDLLYGLLTNF